MSAVAGISGGRTSAMMAYGLPDDVVLCFQNTGFEHPKTLEFLRRVEDDIGRPVVRLEWRSPARGLAPKFATFEAVRHEDLAVRGEPFLDLLACVAAFRRAVKGLGPVAPWARSRICTAYLKIRTQKMYCLSRGWADPTIYVGLRADEPTRVAKMRARNSERDTDERAPLFDAGVTKSDVMRFWGRKPFDLEVPEYLGNCTGCFLKDERDLATALLDPATQAEKWIAIERDFAPMRRGRPSYAQVLSEAPERMRIRAAVAAGRAVVTDLPKWRHRLIVKQELEPSSEFSCSCEGAERMDDDELLQLMLPLPEAA